MTVDDGELTDSGTFTLTVNPVNDAPILSSVDAQSIDEDNTFTYTLSASDVDDVDLEYTASVDGNASVSIDGSSLSIAPYLNYHGDVAVSVTVSDGQLTDSGSFTLAVNPINDAPVLATLDNGETPEDVPLAYILSASDVDGDTLTYSATSSDGSVDFVGSNLIIKPDNNYNGTQLDPKLSYAKIAEACGIKGDKMTTQSTLTEDNKVS